MFSLSNEQLGASQDCASCIQRFRPHAAHSLRRRQWCIVAQKELFACRADPFYPNIVVAAYADRVSDLPIPPILSHNPLERRRLSEKSYSLSVTGPILLRQRP